MSIVQQGVVAPGARAVTWFASGLSIACFLLPIFAVGPHRDLLALAALILPLVIFVIVLCVPEAFAVSHKRLSAPTLNVLPAMSVIGLFAASAHVGFLDWRIALAPAGLCAAISLLLGLGLIGQRLPGGLWLSILFWAGFGGGYGYGAMTFADMHFDSAPSQVFQAQIQREYLSYGRHSATPHLVLAPWGPMTGETDIAVSDQTYSTLKVGDSACVTLHPGLLGMPWYRAGLCDGNWR